MNRHFLASSLAALICSGLSAQQIVISNQTWVVIPGQQQINTPFFVEQSDDLNGALWTRVVSPPVFINGQTRITLARPPGNRFYRLRKE